MQSNGNTFATTAISQTKNLLQNREKNKKSPSSMKIPVKTKAASKTKIPFQFHLINSCNAVTRKILLIDSFDIFNFNQLDSIMSLI